MLSKEELKRCCFYFIILFFCQSDFMRTKTLFIMLVDMLYKLTYGLWNVWESILENIEKTFDNNYHDNISTAVLHLLYTFSSYMLCMFVCGQY